LRSHKDVVKTIRESEPQTTNKTNELICLLANSCKLSRYSSDWTETASRKPQGCHFKKTMESHKLPNQEHWIELWAEKNNGSLEKLALTISIYIFQNNVPIPIDCSFQLKLALLG